jgi:hypothetical protein
MHRRPLAVGLAAAMLLAACGDDAPAPTQALAPRFQVAASCNPAAVRAALASVLENGRAKSGAIPAFNRAEQTKRQSGPAAARPEYYAIIDFVLGEHAAGRIDEPRNFADASDAVEFVVSSLYRCAGDAPPADLGGVLDDIEDGGGSTIACAGGAGLPTDCTLPNGDVTVLAEPGFLTGPALVVIELDPANDPFTPVYGERWSPVWRIRVLPITAQANYPQHTGPAGPVVALAAVGLCVVDQPGGSGSLEHPSLDELQVSQGAAGNVIPPFLLERIAALNGVVIDDRLECAEGSTDVGLLPTSPFGASRLAVAGWRALRDAGSAVGGLLAPKPLYAAAFFDGGIGGKVTSFESWYAAVPPTTAPEVSSVSLRRESTTGPDVTGAAVFLAPGEPETVVAIPRDGAGAPIAGVTCTFGVPVEETPVLTLAPAGPNAVTATWASAGGTVLTATCGAASAFTQIVTSTGG